MGLWAQAETRNSEVLADLNAENLSYEIVYHDTSDEQKAALAQGAVDVISSVSLSPIANSRIVAQFAPWPYPYYFDSTKGNTDLVRTLDETIARVDQVDPNLQDTLYDTYFRVVNDAFVLSDSQKSVLNGMGTLRVLCAENAAPYAYSMEGAPPACWCPSSGILPARRGWIWNIPSAATGRARGRCSSAGTMMCSWGCI